MRRHHYDEMSDSQMQPSTSGLTIFVLKPATTTVYKSEDGYKLIYCII